MPAFLLSACGTGSAAVRLSCLLNLRFLSCAVPITEGTDSFNIRGSMFGFLWQWMVRINVVQVGRNWPN